MTKIVDKLYKSMLLSASDIQSDITAAFLFPDVGGSYRLVMPDCLRRQLRYGPPLQAYYWEHPVRGKIQELTKPDWL